MISSSRNKLFLILIPLIGILITLLAMPYAARLPVDIIEKIPFAPYLIFVGATFLGGFFKRHRTAMISLTYSMAYLVLHNSGFSGGSPTNHQALIFAITAFLLPLNIAWLASSKEQQVISSKGFMTTIILLGQFLGAYWLFKNYSHQLSQMLFYQIDALKGFIIPKQFSLALLASFTTSISILIYHTVKKKGLFEITFLGSLVSTMFFFSTDMAKEIDTIYYSLSGLILLWGLMHNSYVIAYVDELTELPGRRAMVEEMSRLKGHYSIAMLDIDFFKKFNDTYGHDVGDQVLKMVAGKIRQVGGGGKPFRYGGEEFSIIFPGKDSKAAFPYLSNLREVIDGTHLILRSKNRPSTKPDNLPTRRTPWRQEVHVTISIGVATSSGDLDTAEHVMKAADDALYRSKEKGRNCISQHSTKNYVPDLSSHEGAVH